IGVVRTGSAVTVAVPHVHLFVTPLENRLARLGRKLLPRGVDVEPELITETRQHPGEVLGRLAHRPRRDGAFGERQVRVGDDEVRIDLLLDAEAGALGAGAIGGVQRERPGPEVGRGHGVAGGGGTGGGGWGRRASRKTAAHGACGRLRGRRTPAPRCRRRDSAPSPPNRSTAAWRSP